MNLQDNCLPFWHFFHRIEKELSYERWIDKYKLFLQTLHGQYLQYDDEGKSLLAFCRFLYLQDVRHSQVFDAIFRESWKKEKNTLEEYFKHQQQQTVPVETNTPEPVKPDDKAKLSNESEHRTGSQKNAAQQTESAAIQKKTAQEKPYFINPPDISKIKIDPAPEKDSAGIKKAVFNLQDEYLPVSRREMVKAWQHFRTYEKGAPTNLVNIPETVKKIAREKLFTDAVYHFGKKNKKNTIIIFADRNGSMVPFHELTNRLIATAKQYGGHSELLTFYFQNFPLGYVYKKSNLTRPVKTVEALSTLSKSYTTAVIISDAGFARAYGSDERFKTRKEYLAPFLLMLKDRCAHTIWLNPMQENRWYTPVARAINKSGASMAPIMGDGLNPFQNILRTIFRRQVKMN